MTSLSVGLTIVCMKFERRGYETRAVADIRIALAHHRRVVAVGPTGCGKTVVAALLIKQLPKLSVLFVAHKYELVDQAHGRLADHGIRAGVIMAHDEAVHGTDRVDPSARVQVASIQTVIRRGGPKRVDLIIVDEAHRIIADSYQDLIACHPNAMVLGLTATPQRMDGKPLGDFFHHMVTIARPSELYKAGYLAQPDIWAAPKDATAELVERARGAKIGKGDYTPKSVAKIVNSKTLIGKVVSEAIRLAPGVAKVVFAGSVEHSMQLRDRFRHAGIQAAHLDANTDPHERALMLSDLRSGAIEVVCNFGVLTEGWDLPELGAVIIARPTRSKTLLFQMAGRVQRPYRGLKPVILDHGNCCIALGIDPRDDYPWNLEGADRGGGESIVKSCAECLAIIPGGCTVCPSCGAEQPKTDRQEAEEIEAKLVELERGRMAALRERVEAMAREKGAPKGWVQKVMREMRV